MRPMSILIAGSLALMSLIAATAQAAETPRIDAREQRQEARIAQGVASGELTARETRSLVRGQRVVDAKQRAAEADGVVTARERAIIHQEQNQQNRRIYRQKHDAQRRRF